MSTHPTRTLICGGACVALALLAAGRRRRRAARPAGPLRTFALRPPAWSAAACSAAESVLSVHDASLQRGDGTFEVVRAVHGRAFRAAAHVRRLLGNCRRLELPLPPHEAVEAAIEAAAAARVDGMVRVHVARGAPAELLHLPGASGPTVWVFDLPSPPTPRSLRLRSMAAPWHPAGAAWSMSADGLGACKWTSYGPNLASTRAAAAAGADDALLLSAEGGLVLEGPRFCVGWFVADGTLCTPSLDLDILPSVTRAAVLEAVEASGGAAREGRWTLEELKRDATEVVAFSTNKHVLPVVAVDGREFAAGPRYAALERAFMAIVERECAGVRAR